MTETTQDERPGRRFGRYRVVGVLGSGGMGEVLLAHDDLLDREVAVKTLRGQLSASMKGLVDERLFREARAIAALGHPNIVRIFDMGIDDGVPYLVMEAVRGPTLKQRLAQGPLGAMELRSLGIQIARALDAAHGKGILHRDVKPSNILEAEPHTWKLADFGIAHTPDSSLTITGQFLGTPMYAAPESILDGRFSQASDVYGLAATLYEAACGLTVAGPDGEVTVAERLTRGVKPPGTFRAGVPRDIERVIMAGLSLQPGERPTAAQLAERLARAAETRSRQQAVASAAPRRSRTVLVIGTVAILGGAVGLGFYLGRSNVDDERAPAATAQPAAVEEDVDDVEIDPPEPVAAPAVATAPAPPVEPAADAAAPVPEPPPPPEATAVAEPPPVSVPGVDEVKKLIAARRRESAIDRLQALRKKYPKDAEVPFLLGNLYFEKQWWEHGFANYKVAIANDPAYRENATLIRHAIQNLKSPSQKWRGIRFLTRDIGAPAIPHLEAAVKSGPGYIRTPAKQILAKLRK